MTETKGKPFGVYSEVGKLHKVMVCSPGIAHQPADAKQLRRSSLFDDVLWVERQARSFRFCPEDAGPRH